jgi:diguanylate cyclase (GGDEF)-like protein
MELTIQLALAGFSIAVLLVLRAQMRSMDALRWWVFAGCAALIAQSCDGLANANIWPPVNPFLYFLALVAGVFVLALYFLGIIKLESSITSLTRRLALASIAILLFSIAIGGFATPAENLTQIFAATSQLGLPVLCAVVGTYVWHRRSKQLRFATTIASLQFLAAALALLDRVFGLHLSSASAYMTLASGLSKIAVSVESIALMLAIVGMAYLAVDESSKEFEVIEASSESVHRLLNSGANGVCELDAHGQIKVLNPPAAKMLGLDVALVGSASIHDFLEPWHGADSEAALSSLLLRPSVPVKNAVARLNVAGDESMIVEWSTSPVMCGTEFSGSMMTMRDVTQRDVQDRYRSKRFEVLEMIARNRPVDEITKNLCNMFEVCHPRYHCSVLQCGPEFFRVAAAPSVPEDLRNEMNQIPCVRSFRAYELVDDNEQKWNVALRATASNHGFNGVWTEPMVSSAHELLGHVVLTDVVPGSLSADARDTLRDAAHLAGLAFEHRCSFERLLHQGHHDTLTGLPNRLLLADRLNQALARAERMHTQMALMCIDLDRFKYVNDTMGHDAGDQFLQQISVRLQARIRSSDTLARTGGDEFTVILGDVLESRDAIRVAESLLASLREPFHIDDHTLYGAATIGIALYPIDGRDADSLHRNADRAMYRGKALGKNSVQCYSETDTGEDNDRIEIDTQLRRAIEDGSFEVHYQPQFSCDRKLAGFEALLRFNHPTLGLVPPSRFIPMAEESGLVLPIGTWVLHEVCRQIAEWQSKGMHPVHVAVNVSPLQFAQADFANTIAQALKSHNVRPDLLELELTEGVLMSGVHDSKAQMESIAKIGVRLSVDDFGTGYSSLSYLHQLPIQVLKIDRSFVSKMLEPDGTQCIVDAIISLAHRLGLKTVAEGVEEHEQLELLRAAGCDLIQGFLFSHPLKADDASSLIFQQTKFETGAPVLAAPALVEKVAVGRSERVTTLPIRKRR